MPNATKQSKGERVGKVPYGFDLAADGVQLVPNAAEQRVLELIAQLRQKGYTLRDIADELTRRGIPSKGNKAVWKKGADGKTNPQDGDQGANTQTLGRSGNVRHARPR